jgi:hypothetical protein
MVERSFFQLRERGAAVGLGRAKIADAQRQFRETEGGACAAAGRGTLLGVASSAREVTLIERDLAEIGERRRLPVGTLAL